MWRHDETRTKRTKSNKNEYNTSHCWGMFVIIETVAPCSLTKSAKGGKNVRKRTSKVKKIFCCFFSILINATLLGN
jgi:hypothetical protein